MNCGTPTTEEITSANTTQMYTIKDLDPVTAYYVKVYALNTRNLTNEGTVEIKTVEASKWIDLINVIENLLIKITLSYHMLSPWAWAVR